MGAERSATPLPLGPLLAICCSVFVETTAFTQLLPYASFYVETLCSRSANVVDIGAWTGVVFGCFSFCSALANPAWGLIAMRHGAGRTSPTHAPSL